MQAKNQNESDAYETAIEKLLQLEALLASCTGPGFDGFHTLAARHQSGLLELAADLAQDARERLEIQRQN